MSKEQVAAFRKSLAAYTKKTLPAGSWLADSPSVIIFNDTTEKFRFAVPAGCGVQTLSNAVNVAISAANVKLVKDPVLYVASAGVMVEVCITNDD